MNHQKYFTYISNDIWSRDWQFKIIKMGEHSDWSEIETFTKRELDWILNNFPSTSGHLMTPMYGSYLFGCVYLDIKKVLKSNQDPNVWHLNLFTKDKKVNIIKWEDEYFTFELINLSEPIYTREDGSEATRYLCDGFGGLKKLFEFLDIRKQKSSIVQKIKRVFSGS